MLRNIKQSFEKMSNSNNSFDLVISSFEKACKHLENTSALKMIETKERLEKDTISAVETVSEFNKGVNDISSASDYLLQSEVLMKKVRENSLKKDSILLSQDIQADAINCIKEVYNLKTPFPETSEKKLIENKFEDLSDSIQKVTFRTINQADNIKNTLLTNMRLTENI